MVSFDEFMKKYNSKEYLVSYSIAADIWNAAQEEAKRKILEEHPNDYAYEQGKEDAAKQIFQELDKKITSTALGYHYKVFTSDYKALKKKYGIA